MSSTDTYKKPFYPLSLLKPKQKSKFLLCVNKRTRDTCSFACTKTKILEREFTDVQYKHRCSKTCSCFYRNYSITVQLFVGLLEVVEITTRNVTEQKSKLFYPSYSHHLPPPYSTQFAQLLQCYKREKNFLDVLTKINSKMNFFLQIYKPNKNKQTNIFQVIIYWTAFFSASFLLASCFFSFLISQLFQSAITILGEIFFTSIFLRFCFPTLTQLKNIC